MDFAILGELEVFRSGEPIELGSPRQRALLARLLVSANEAVSADRLVDDLWPDDAGDGARHTLHVYVSRIRKALGEDSARLEHRSSGYAFRVDSTELDATRFEMLAAEGRAAITDGDSETGRRLLAEALAMWRGPALCEFLDDEFARIEATRLDELRLNVTEQVMWAELESGNHDGVIEDLRDLTSDYPFREAFWEQRMLALYRSGRQADALRTFQTARRVLGDELGIEPGPAMREMEERILTQDPQIEWTRRADSDAIQASLPLQRTSFIGRGAELARTMALLESHRLLTLTGPPGTGKTRLALRLAMDAADRFGDGTLFVPLTSVGEPHLMMESVAQALQLREVPEQPTIDTVTAFLRRRSMLLVLDSFEHLLPAGSQVGRLLDAAPDLTVIVTSRGALGISGEQVFPVPPLSVPPASLGEDPEAIASYDAAALFIARARAVEPGFVVTSDNGSAIARITDRLDGLPLAIELAAARTPLMPPEELAERLTQRLAFLTGGPADVETRHRTMRDAIDWSYSLLEPHHRSLFRRLGVFVGGFTLEAAAVVWDDDDGAVIEGVDSLLAMSLVHRPAEFGRARYGLLEMIREFALEELSSEGEAADARRRHAEYFGVLAAEAEPTLATAEGRQLLEAEVGNIRAALRCALDIDDPDLGLELGYSIWRFWQGSDRMAEGRSWLEQLLAHPLVSTAAQANGLTALAGLAYWQADHDEALERYEQALSLYRSLGDRSSEAETLFSMSLTATWSGDLERGSELADEAGEVFSDLDVPGASARVNVARGFVRLRGGEYALAYDDYAQAHATAERLGDRHFATTLLAGMAACAFHLGDRDDAITVALRAVDEAAEARNDGISAWLLDIVASLTADVAPADATKLAGAAAAHRDAAGGGMPIHTLGLTAASTTAAAHLSPEELARAWAEGERLSLDEAVARAHEVCSAVRSTTF